MGPGQPKIDIEGVGHCSCAVYPFRVAGQLRAAVIVRATFLVVPGRAAVLSRPEPLVAADVYRRDDPARGLVAASDLVPHRPGTDVLLLGHARAPAGRAAPWVGVRLLVARTDALLLDKQLLVRGPPDPAAGGAEPAPFESLPLSHEHAAPWDGNPAAGRAPGTWPRILDAWRRPAPLGTGPISPAWPMRMRLVQNAPSFAGPVPDFGREFPWTYFHAAPPDQRIGLLQGDEWVRLEGTHSQFPRVDVYLPGAYAVARVHGDAPGFEAGREIGLRGDTLVIDADRMRLSVVWRASFAVPDERAAWWIVAGAGTHDQPFTLPAGRPRSSGRPASSGTAMPPQETLDVDLQAAAAATPFQPGSAAAVREEPSTVDGAEGFASAGAGLPFVAAPPPSRRPRPRLPPATPFDRLLSDAPPSVERPPLEEPPSLRAPSLSGELADGATLSEGEAEDAADGASRQGETHGPLGAFFLAAIRSPADGGRRAETVAGG